MEAPCASIHDSFDCQALSFTLLFSFPSIDLFLTLKFLNAGESETNDTTGMSRAKKVHLYEFALFVQQAAKCKDLLVPKLRNTETHMMPVKEAKPGLSNDYRTSAGLLNASHSEAFAVPLNTVREINLLRKAGCALTRGLLRS